MRDLSNDVRPAHIICIRVNTKAFCLVAVGYRGAVFNCLLEAFEASMLGFKAIRGQLSVWFRCRLVFRLTSKTHGVLGKVTEIWGFSIGFIAVHIETAVIDRLSSNISCPIYQ